MKDGTIDSVTLVTRKLSTAASAPELTAFRVMTEQEAVTNETGRPCQIQGVEGR